MYEGIGIFFSIIFCLFLIILLFKLPYWPNHEWLKSWILVFGPIIYFLTGIYLIVMYLWLPLLILAIVLFFFSKNSNPHAIQGGNENQSITISSANSEIGSSVTNQEEHDSQFKINHSMVVSKEYYMNFAKDTKDGFILANCEKCGNEIKLYKSICKIEGDHYKVSRKIDCYRCGEKFDIIKGVAGVNSNTMVEADEKINHQKDMMGKNNKQKLEKYKNDYNEFIAKYLLDVTSKLAVREVLKFYLIHCQLEEVLDSQNIIFLKRYLFKRRSKDDLSLQTIKEMIIELSNSNDSEHIRDSSIKSIDDKNQGIEKLIIVLNGRIKEILSRSQSENILVAEQSSYGLQEQDSTNDNSVPSFIETEVEEDSTKSQHDETIVPNTQDTLKGSILRLVAQLNISIKDMSNSMESNQIHTDSNTTSCEYTEVTSEIAQVDTSEIIVAEFEIFNEEVSYTSPISIPSITQTKPLPNNIYNKMMKLSNELYGNGWYYDRSKIFVLQGKFMEFHEESISNPVDFMSYSPTYKDMSTPQLKWYFTWRTRVRNGDIKETSLSYAYVYIYELLNQIGVNSPEDGLKKLVDFWNEYRKYDEHLDRYLTDWIKDYIIYYGCNCDYIEVVETVMNDKKSDAFTYNTAKLIQAVTNRKYSETLEYLNTYSRYKIFKSKFYESEWGYTVNEVMEYVIPAIEKYQNEKRKTTLLEKLVGKTKTEVWQPFRSAVFLNQPLKEGYEFFFNTIEKYWVKGNEWYTTFGRRWNSVDSDFISQMLKCTEAVLRDEIKYKYSLKLDGISKEMQTVIRYAVSKYCVERGLIEKVQKTQLLKKNSLSNKNDKDLSVVPKPVKLEFDSSKLNDLRKQSVEIQKMLTVEETEELMNEFPIARTAKDIDATKQLSNIEHEAFDNKWSKLAKNLTDNDKVVLNILILQDDVNKELAQVARKRNTLLEVLIEEINEQSLECIGDNIIDTSNITPYIYDDYVEEVKNIIMEA